MPESPQYGIEPGFNPPEQSSASRAGQALVGLNHVFCSVDQATYAAIVRSGFVRNTFALAEERTTRTTGGNQWCGFYLYGEHTYIELFRPADNGDAEAESAGIAYGLERPGQVAELADLLGREFGKPATLRRMDRVLGSEAVPWFQMIWANRDASAAIRTFGMEYVPEFLARWHGEKPPRVMRTEEALRRQVVLERCAAVLGVQREDRLFRNVRVIRLALDETAATDLGRELRALGYDLVDGGPEGVAYLGPELRLEIRKDSRKQGIVGLGLRRSVSGVQEIELAASRLALVGDRAWWALGAENCGTAAEDARKPMPFRQIEVDR